MPPRRQPVEPGDPILQNQPYAFPSSMGTWGTNVVNGGALFAGDSRPFNQNDLNNSISKPFWVTRIKFTVTRVAGGDEVDADYAEVLCMVEGSTLDMKYLRTAGPLSSVTNKFTREWLLPGKLCFGWQNGGANVEMSVRNGSRGAPFNLDVTFHGFLQANVPVDESHLPRNQPG